MDHTSRCMGEFLVHPTMPAFEQATGDTTGHAQNAAKPDARIVSPTQEKWKSIDFATNMLHELAERPLMLHQYNSDEDIASPLDGDDENDEENHDSQDGDSEDDSMSTFSDLASLSESLSDSLSQSWYESDDEDYVRAETVAFIPVGKPRVVSLPPSPTALGYFDVPVPESTTSAPSQHWRDEKFPFSDLPDAHELLAVATRQPSMSSQGDAHNASPSNTHDEDRVDTFYDNTQYDLSNSRPRNFSIPIISTNIRRSASTSGNMVSTQPSDNQDSFSSSRTPAVPRSSFHSLSRNTLRPSLSLRKLSPNLFSRLTKPFESTQRVSSIKEAPVVEETFSVSTRPKMVARDANERAKPITLPPCPVGYKPDVEPVPVSDLANRSNMTSHKTPGGRLH